MWVASIGVLLIVGAAAIRFWGIGWGLPYVYHADEPVNLTTTLTMLQDGDPNPHFFNYPPFYYYVEAGGQLAYYGLGMASGDFESISDISTPEMQTLANGRLANPNSLLAGRLVSVAFSIGTVVIVFAAVLAVSGSLSGATLAGLLMALGPLAVRRGRLMTSDPIATFFTAAALAASYLVLRRGRTVDYALAGILVGLAGSTKYHAALIAVAVFVAHVMRTGKRFAADRRIYLAGGVAVATFVITSPFVVFDAGTFWAELAWKTDFYSGAQAGGGAASLPFYARVVAAEYGPLLLVIPFAFTVRRFRREALLATGFAVLYLAFITFFVVRFDRHVLLALPAIAVTIGLGVAGLVVVLRERLVSWAKVDARVWLAVVGAVMMLGLLIPVAGTASDGARYSSDERAGAREWIHQSLPADSTVLVDAYSPFVDPERFEITAVSFAATAGGDSGQYAYVVIAEQGSGRFLADPSAYPDQAAGFEERLGDFCEVAYFPGPPWIRVLAQDCPAP